MIYQTPGSSLVNLYNSTEICKYCDKIMTVCIDKEFKDYSQDFSRLIDLTLRRCHMF